MRTISLDNGQSFLRAHEVPAEWLTGRKWETLARLMNDETREHVHSELAPCDNATFLRRYLELAPEDLIVG